MTSPIVRSEVFANMLIEGAGGADLGLEDDGKGSADITITQIPWDRIWYDPHSRSYDFADARYKVWSRVWTGIVMRWRRPIPTRAGRHRVVLQLHRLPIQRSA